jgi:archaemetzincin
MGRLKVSVCPQAGVPPQVVGAAREALAQALPVDTILGPLLVVPRRAWNAARRQYVADLLMQAVPEAVGAERHLGIVYVDLYTPGLNFVFGMAAGRRAVISIARLATGEQTPTAAKCLRRVAVEAVHEIGHTLGLPHCRNARCVMYFSNTLADTDRKSWKLCERCRARLEKNRRQG